MDFINLRRSIRKYTAEDVSEDDLRQLLQAAMAAPSAGNQQPWHFIVVRDSARKKSVTEFHEYASMLCHAPVAIVVCADLAEEKFEGFWVQDCSAAIENLLLKAVDIGLGAVWLGIHPIKNREDGCRKLFGLPETVMPLAIIALGHPAEEKGPSNRFRQDRVHIEKW